MGESGTTRQSVQHMKWWGWGQDGVAFHHDDKPGFAAFVQKKIGIDVDRPAITTADLDRLQLPKAAPLGLFREDLIGICGEENVSEEKLDRVVHTFGKSLRDLLRIRAGRFDRVPDIVVYPSSETEVVEIVEAALRVNAVLIPFGGGTNISGSLEPGDEELRPVVSVDMGRMNRVLEIDDDARTAQIEAGALGPHLEAQLNEQGWTIGHFPDSFNHSTLGGWVATRSSGMQSDKYGDIADLTKAVRVVTPSGVLVTRNVPSQSTGPSVREMILGSEGRLGIITEATVQVHRTPEKRSIIGYLFPEWSRAIAAMRDIAASDYSPSVTRVSDASETGFSFATKKKSSKSEQLKSDAFKVYLEKRKHFDVNEMCLSFIGYEGSPEHVKAERKGVEEIVSAHGGVAIGSGPGAIYDQKKFDTPYIRDFLLDRGGLADVSETAAPWSQLVAMHDGVIERANKAFDDIGVQGFIMCHMSHSYHSGACLYFTFAFEGAANRDPIEQYDVVKSAIQQGFIDIGGTLSHHHAVGLEHARWMKDDVSPAGVAMMQALFEGVDPGRNFNPGKILPEK